MTRDVEEDAPLLQPTAPLPWRGWFAAQLLIGWVPVWALYTSMMVIMHGGSILAAAVISARAIGIAALLGLVVIRGTRRFPWPRKVSPAFVAGHLVAAIVFAMTWLLLTSLVEATVRGFLFLHQVIWVVPFTMIGIWLYVGVAGVSYASSGSARAARAEATAARSQLAALRGQLNPHFLFNALHTVVHLIPVEPARAAEAAERLASLLRTTTAEDRDVVPLGDELAFVERYLDLERLRFDDRLHVRTDVAADARAVLVPSFAVQTLVENAVRHGAAPREGRTTIDIRGAIVAGTLTLEVEDDGAGAAPIGAPGAGEATNGSGLRRLRERLDALYGSRARITTGAPPTGGYRARLELPAVAADD